MVTWSIVRPETSQMKSTECLISYSITRLLRNRRSIENSIEELGLLFVESNASVACCISLLDWLSDGKAVVPDVQVLNDSTH